MRNNPHKEVTTKVNALVDEGIAKLVELLNTIDVIRTFESCQGTENEPAYIYLHYGINKGDNGKESLIFASNLAKGLSKRCWDNPFDSIERNIAISVHWWGDKIHPFVAIEMPSDIILEATNVFADLLSEFGVHILNR